MKNIDKQASESLIKILEKAYENTVDSLYLEHPLSRTSLYVELKSQSLCVSCNLFFSLYLELSLSRTKFLVPCKFEIERVNCIPNFDFVKLFDRIYVIKKAVDVLITLQEVLIQNLYYLKKEEIDVFAQVNL